MDVSKMPTMDSVARFKAAMESDKGALGPFMISTDPAFVEAAGYAGYDFVLLDMELAGIIDRLSGNYYCLK